jgi:hypothetical protein
MIRRCFLRAGMAAAIVAVSARNLVAAAWKYPPRGSLWSGCRNWQHLAYASAHRGKFDVKWLQSLSYYELQSLHSDDHERRVHWDKVNQLVVPTPPKQYYHQRQPKMWRPEA